MKRLFVCPEHELDLVIERHQPTWLIRLTGPDGDGSPPTGFSGAMLHLAFNDIAEPRPGLVPPSQEHVRALLNFSDGWQEGVLVAQCWMGISRSTAAALLLALVHGKDKDPTHLAQELRRVAPSATPNALMIAHGDALLSCGGAFISAVQAIGRGADAPHGTAFEMPLGAP